MYKLTADWGDGTVLWEREIENCEMPGAVLVVVKELEGLELMKPSDLAAVLRSRAEEARREE